jgi:hypothetical protein
MCLAVVVAGRRRRRKERSIVMMVLGWAGLSPTAFAMLLKMLLVVSMCG